MSDRELIASLRAAAGLPTQEEIFSISPYSDDEENGPMIGRSLKFSLKGLLDKSPKKNKEYGKKYSNKKYNKKKGYQTSVVSIELHEGSEGQHDARSDGCSLGDEKNDELQSQRNEALDISSPVVGILSHAEGICSTNQPITRKHKFVEEVMVSDEDRTPRVVKIKSNKPHGPDSEDAVEQQSSKLKTGAKKLVINLGPRKINVTNSQKTDASTCRREDLTTSNGISFYVVQHSFKGSKFGRLLCKNRGPFLIEKSGIPFLIENRGPHKKQKHKKINNSDENSLIFLIIILLSVF